MVSNVGTQVSQLAFPLLILALTGSAAQAGFAGTLRALPYVIFSLPVYAIAPNPFVLGVLSAASLFMGPVYNVVQFSYRSAIIPDELQGRVNSVFRLIAFGGQPLGLALTGLLIQNIGVVQTVFICTFGMVAFALAANLNRHVRNAQPLKEVGNV